MEEAAGSSYWCHVCSQTVNPIMEIETIKCPLCQGGFIEEMASAAASPTPGTHSPLDSEGALSLWAPILLGMMGDPSLHRRRLRRMGFQDDGDEVDNNHRHDNGEAELDQELESIMRRRRRSTAAILQLLQGIRAGMVSESGNDNWDGDRYNDRDGGERVILINPFNQTIIVQGANDESNNRAPTGDYFIGTDLDLLLQHLSENDPNRYGTPPAKKESVEALPTVKVEETLQCCVCLDDCEMGSQVKEMPCKHKFHDKCILSWLELHSSCPVCRHQLPADESKLDQSENSTSNDNERNGNGGRFSLPLLWPFSSLFSSSSSSSSSSQSSNGATPPSGLSTNEAPSPSHADEN